MLLLINQSFYVGWKPNQPFYLEAMNLTQSVKQIILLIYTELCQSEIVCGLANLIQRNINFQGIK